MASFMFRSRRMILQYAICLMVVTAINALVTVRPVQSQKDMFDLADLRYDEWILSPEDQDLQQSPSRAAFRAATVEITEERTKATPYLARLDDSSTTTSAVGAVELSFEEFEGVTDRNMLYVTDLVVAKDYRRQGIAQSIMKALEIAAQKQQCECLLLHVKKDNLRALEFYREKLQYAEQPTTDILDGVDLDRLSSNTNTAGQILLCKVLSQ